MSWNIEQVWGSDRFYHEGDVAEDQFAFIIDSGIAKLDDLNVNEEWSKSFVNGFDDPFEDISGHGTAVASLMMHLSMQEILLLQTIYLIEQ